MAVAKPACPYVPWLPYHWICCVKLSHVSVVGDVGILTQYGAEPVSIAHNLPSPSHCRLYRGISVPRYTSRIVTVGDARLLTIMRRGVPVTEL